MALSKQDIDALVDGMRAVPGEEADVIIAAWTNAGNTVRVRRDDLRPELYHSAGLTAEGERRPERVRCWLVAGSGSTAFWAYHPDEMNEQVPKGATVTQGWFVPDTESSDAR